MWVEEGWTPGYKVRVGDLPCDISAVTIGQYCHGKADISIHGGHKKDRGHTEVYAIVTFTDVALAIKAFEQLAMAKFEPYGSMYSR